MFASVLDHGDDSARYEAAEQLKEMGPWAAAAVPALIDALNDEDWTNRCAVAEALGEIGPAAVTAIAALTDAIQHDEDLYVQANAVEALGKIGNPTAIPVLITALANEDGYVR